MKWKVYIYGLTLVVVLTRPGVYRTMSAFL